MGSSVPPPLQLLLTFCLILLNGCFVLAEYALIRIRASRVEVLARKGHPAGLLIQEMLRNLDVYLSAVQLGITMASIGVGWLGEPAVASLLGGWLSGLPARASQ